MTKYHQINRVYIPVDLFKDLSKQLRKNLLSYQFRANGLLLL